MPRCGVRSSQSDDGSRQGCRYTQASVSLQWVRAQKRCEAYNEYPGGERQMLTGSARWHRQVVFLRCGQTARSADSQFLGNQDFDINDEGFAAATKAAEQLMLVQPTVILSSDLQRATRTAAALERRTRLVAHRDIRLRPLTAAALEGLTPSEIIERYPDEYWAWEEARGHSRPPGGGESRWEAGRRAADCILEACVRGTDNDTIVVVTHDLTARAAMCAILDLPERYWGMFEEIRHCAWSTLREGRKGWFIGEHNILRIPPSDESNVFAEDNLATF